MQCKISKFSALVLLSCIFGCRRIEVVEKVPEPRLQLKLIGLGIQELEQPIRKTDTDGWLVRVGHQLKLVESAGVIAPEFCSAMPANSD